LSTDYSQIYKPDISKLYPAIIFQPHPEDSKVK